MWNSCVHQGDERAEAGRAAGKVKEPDACLAQADHERRYGKAFLLLVHDAPSDYFAVGWCIGAQDAAANQAGRRLLRAKALTGHTYLHSKAHGEKKTDGPLQKALLKWKPRRVIIVSRCTCAEPLDLVTQSARRWLDGAEIDRYRAVTAARASLPWKGAETGPRVGHDTREKYYRHVTEAAVAWLYGGAAAAFE
jgi:hypothetical protein